MFAGWRRLTGYRPLTDHLRMVRLTSYAQHPPCQASNNMFFIDNHVGAELLSRLLLAFNA